MGTHVLPQEAIQCTATRDRTMNRSSNEQLEQFKVHLLCKCYNLLSSAHCPAPAKVLLWTKGNACFQLYSWTKNPPAHHCRARNVTGTHKEIQNVTLFSSSQSLKRHSIALIARIACGRELSLLEWINLKAQVDRYLLLLTDLSLQMLPTIISTSQEVICSFH